MSFLTMRLRATLARLRSRTCAWCEGGGAAYLESPPADKSPSGVAAYICPPCGLKLHAALAEADGERGRLLAQAHDLRFAAEGMRRQLRSVYREATARAGTWRHKSKTVQANFLAIADMCKPEPSQGNHN